MNCIYCNKEYSDFERHMKRSHPDRCGMLSAPDLMMGMMRSYAIDALNKEVEAILKLE